MPTLKTAHKLRIARTLCSLVLALRRLGGRTGAATVRRGGLWWSLDLAEGIDFSIYLLGAFEPRTVKRTYPALIQPGFTVLDIGANVGAHTLPLARLVGATGKVIAFEPTRWAVEKLRRNLNLNPDLNPRVTLCHAMLVASASETVAPTLYSSWPLFPAGDAVHYQHGGRLMDTRGAVSTTLDAALAPLQLQKIDFVKLDVDGHEPAVLAGARKTLDQWRPPILMELAPYLYPPETGSLETMLHLLQTLGYSMQDVDSSNHLALDPNALRTLIPTGASRNVLLRPNAS